MKIINAGRTIRQIAQWPLMRPALMAFRHAQFLSEQGMGACYGVFNSFNQARESLPQTKEFDNTSLADEYINVRTKKLFSYDYPVIWRVDTALRTGAKKVLDIGGSVGVHYYAYKLHLDSIDSISWHVVEVPAMVEIGINLAQKNRTSALTFSVDLALAISLKYDIWLSAGALQYIDLGKLDQLLMTCKDWPTHILINKIPLYAGSDFVTTQNLGNGCFTPFWVFNRDGFVKPIEILGYKLIDEWAVHERSLYLPGFPNRSFPTFSGLYFRKKTAEIE
jgi:putative methyltransferase (TIGR04325 family)